MIKTYAIPVPNVRCGGCTSKIIKKFDDCKHTLTLENDQVFALTKVTASPAKHMVYIDVSQDSDDVELNQQIGSQLVKEVSYGATEYILLNTEEELLSLIKKIDEAPPSVIPDLIKGSLGLGVGIPLMLLFMILSLLGIALPPLFLYLIAGVSTFLTLYLGAPTYFQAIRELFKERSLGMDSLFTVSTLVAVGVSIASLFVSWLPGMFEVGLVVLGFVKFGDILKKRGERHIKKESFSQNLPETVEVLTKEHDTDGTFENIKEIGPNSIIIVRKGEVCPLDGICLEDETQIDDTILTGSGKDFPSKIFKNDVIFQGMIVPDSVDFIRVKVTHLFKESYQVKQDNALALAKEKEAPIVTIAHKILLYFVPTVFLITAAVTTLSYFLFPPAVAFHLGVMLLVSLCPCLLGILPGLGAAIGLNKATKNGIQFSSGEALQKAANIDLIALDANGTLTKGKPCVREHFIDADENADEILAICHLLEKKEKEKPDHAFAKAIRRYVKTKNSNNHNFEWNVPDIQPDSGRCAIVNGDEYVIGNETLMKNTENFNNYPTPNLSEREQIIYLAKNNRIIGHFILEDSLRPEAPSVVYNLQQMGKKVIMITGASPATALRIAAKVGIDPDDVYADCKNGKEKKAIVEKLKKERGYTIAFVGDGPNDWESMDAADFSVAVQSPSASAVVQSTADAKITDKFLEPLVNLFHIANETITHIKQSLFFSLGYNILAMVVPTVFFMALGGAFLINPAVGAALMFLQAGLVFLNAYRIKHKTVPSLKPLPESLHKSNIVPVQQPKPSVEFERKWAYGQQPSVKEIQGQSWFGKEPQPFIDSLPPPDLPSYDGLPTFRRY